MKLHVPNYRADLIKRFEHVVGAYQRRVRCQCGAPIWIVGSAETGLACFTCITGETAPANDYEIDVTEDDPVCPGRQDGPRASGACLGLVTPSSLTLSKYVMGLSCRMFLVDENDSLYRLANTKLTEMLRDPASHRFPLFAGCRVRVAEAIVELGGREPIRVIRITFDILTFDSDGRFDPSTFGRQQFAHAELATAPSIAVFGGNATVVDATSRFIAQGGRWTPSRTLARAIDDAASGRIKCPRV